MNNQQTRSIELFPFIVSAYFRAYRASACILYMYKGGGVEKGEQRRKRDEYIERRNKIWSEGERDGGVLIREKRRLCRALPPPHYHHRQPAPYSHNYMESHSPQKNISLSLKFTILALASPEQGKPEELHKIAKSGVRDEQVDSIKFVGKDPITSLSLKRFLSYLISQG